MSSVHASTTKYNNILFNKIVNLTGYTFMNMIKSTKSTITGDIINNTFFNSFLIKEFIVYTQYIPDEISFIEKWIISALNPLHYEVTLSTIKSIKQTTYYFTCYNIVVIVIDTNTKTITNYLLDNMLLDIDTINYDGHRLFYIPTNFKKKITINIKYITFINKEQSIQTINLLKVNNYFILNDQKFLEKINNIYVPPELLNIKYIEYYYMHLKITLNITNLDINYLYTLPLYLVDFILNKLSATNKLVF